MLAELMGRFYSTFEYKKLSREDLKRILLTSKTSPLLRKKERYMEEFGYELIWEDGEPVLPAHKVYLQAGEDAKGTYYLTTEIELENGMEFYWQFPVTVLAAEEGTDYQKCPDIIVKTNEEG